MVAFGPACPGDGSAGAECHRPPRRRGDGRMLRVSRRWASADDTDDAAERRILDRADTARTLPAGMAGWTHDPFTARAPIYRGPPRAMPLAVASTDQPPPTGSGAGF